MTKNKKSDFYEFIEELDYQGLKGRLWRAPALKPQAKDHLIIFIYGNHSSLERVRGVNQYLRNFGEILMVDLPGFGGMDSFYKLGKKPTLDNFAHYLHDVLKAHLKPNQKFSIVGFCFGFLIASRFLQLYPTWQPRIRLNISVVGFLSGRSFIFKRIRRHMYILGCWLVANRLGAFVFRYLIVNSWMLRCFYGKNTLSKSKFVNMTKAQKQALLDIEIELWHNNHIRTWGYTLLEMFKSDLVNCKIQTNAYHLASPDQYFDHDLIFKDMQTVFKKAKLIFMKLTNHAPTTIIDPAEARRIITGEVVSLFEKEIEVKS